MLDLDNRQSLLHSYRKQTRDIEIIIMSEE
jgi:hypothetical protein